MHGVGYGTYLRYMPDFYEKFMQMLKSADIHVKIWPCPCRAFSIASLPFSASPQTSKSFSRANNSQSAPRIAGSSSTISTDLRGKGSFRNITSASRFISDAPLPPAVDQEIRNSNLEEIYICLSSTTRGVQRLPARLW